MPRPAMKAKHVSRIGLCQAAGTVSLRLAMPDAKSRPSCMAKTLGKRFLMTCKPHLNAGAQCFKVHLMATLVHLLP